MKTKAIKIWRILICSALTAIFVVLGVLCMMQIPDIGRQSRDAEKIGQMNEVLTEHKDEIGSYADAMNILAENGYADFSFEQNNPYFYYSQSGKTVFSSGAFKASWFYSSCIDTTYRYSKIDIFRNECQVVVTCLFASSSYNFYLLTPLTDVGELRECVGSESFTVPGSDIEREALVDYFTHTVFYDGEAYSYREGERGNLYREDISDVRSADLYGYNLVVTDRITHIDGGLFDGSYFFSVQMADAVTEIGEGAFSGCRFLESVDFSECLTTIGKNAFSDCISLNELELSKNLTSVGENAFLNDKSIARVYFPSSLENCADSAFEGCDNVSVINYQGTSQEYSERKIKSLFPDFSGRVTRYEDNLYTSGYSRLVRDTDTEELTYTADCFIGTVLDVSIPVIYAWDEITYACRKIEDYGYSYLTFLRTINIKDGVPKIGEYAFYHTSAESIVISASVSEIGTAAFSSNYRLKSFTVSEDNQYYASVGGALFELNGRTAALLCFPSGYEGDYIMPSSFKWNGVVYDVNEVRENAFSNAVKLQNVYIPDTVAVDENNFEGCINAEIVR